MNKLVNVLVASICLVFRLGNYETVLIDAERCITHRLQRVVIATVVTLIIELYFLVVKEDFISSAI